MSEIILKTIMSQDTLNPAEMTEDQVLAYTRSKRMELANKLTENGVPTEKETAGVLLQTLDGLDRSSLTRLRIKADEQANKNNTASQALIAEVLNKIGSSRPYEMEGVARREAPQLPSTIPDPVVVEGELETNPAQMDFESFTKQFEVPPGQDQS